MKVFHFLQKAAAITYLLALPVGAEQTPDITNISSENFSQRELATQRLRTWAMADKENATQPLLRYYFSSKDPEFRSRLHWVLEDIRINSASSYLGLSYLPEKSAIGGAKSIVLSVKRLKDGGPAELSGLAVGDKIITVDGTSFNENMDTTDIRVILGSLPGGKKVIFTILRAEKRLSVNVRPQAKERKPEDTAAAQAQFKKWLIEREKEFQQQP